MRTMYILSYSLVKNKIVEEYKEESNYAVQDMFYYKSEDKGYTIHGLSREHCIKRLLKILENKVKSTEKELNKYKNVYEIAKERIGVRL